MSAYGKCPLMRSLKCSVGEDKSPGPWFGVRLLEVSVNGGSTVRVMRQGFAS